MKNALDRNNKRLDISEENNKLEEVTTEIIQNETQKEKKNYKNEQSLSQWAVGQVQVA